MSGDAASYGSLQRHISGRDPDLWAARGRLLLLLAAVASLLFALVTFIAHNWVYLSTVGKLAGIAGLLILFTGLWIWKGVDTLWGQIFGVTAQLLIGVWLPDSFIRLQVAWLIC